MRLCYISRNYKSTSYAGGKARVDIEEVLEGMGAVNLGLGQSHHANQIVDFGLNLAGIARMMATVGPGDVVLIQYPLKKYYKAVCRWARMRGARTITLIHDLGSFRRKKLTVEQEIAKLSLSDCLIVHNANMAAWLRDKGFRKPMIELGVFDYLSPAKAYEAEDGAYSCTFIGDVRPHLNGFIYELPAPVSVHLYGGYAPDGVDTSRFFSYGSKTHDELISGAKGRYGLVWYGNSASGHSGFVGEYFKYNAPHKLSLYLRCGKPIIISREAGEAQFVEKEGIGITIDSLADLDKTLAAVSGEQYTTMKENVRRVAAAIASGNYVRTAVKAALKAVE